VQSKTTGDAIGRVAFFWEFDVSVSADRDTSNASSATTVCAVVVAVDAVGRIAIFGEFGNVVSTRCVADKGAVGRAIHTIRRIALFGRKIDKPVSADRYALAGTVACRGTRRLALFSGSGIHSPVSTAFERTVGQTRKDWGDRSRRVAFFSGSRVGQPVSAKQSRAVGAAVDAIRGITFLWWVDVSVATNRYALTRAVTRRCPRRRAFLSGINISVPTTRELAGRGTIKYGVDGTRRIAFFRSVVVDRPVATKLDEAQACTPVATDDISVITLFGRRIQMSISTDGNTLARRVAKHRIGRLTFLAWIYVSIATTGQSTVGGAVEHRVYNTRRVTFFVGPDGPIAAFNGAIGTAPIIVDVVPIIALFPGLVDDPVSTTSLELARRRTPIPVHKVAIVTLFRDFKDTVATRLWIARVSQSVSVEVFLAWVGHGRAVVADIPYTIPVNVALVRV
jgi:hypothetical protein